MIFLLNVPIAHRHARARADEAAAARARESEGARVDFVGGIALRAPGSAGSCSASSSSRSAAGATSWSRAGSPAAPSCLAAFVVWEMRTPQPMLPLRLFGMRNFSVTNIETFAVYGGLSTWGFFLALFLQQISGYSPFRSGLATVPVTIVMFVLSRYAGRFSMRYGPRLFMAAGPLIAGASTLALARLPVHLNYWTDLLPPLLGFALGLTLTVAPLTTTVLSDAGPGDAGVASGVNNAVARIAGLVAIAVVGIAAASGSGAADEHGFHIAMLITGAADLRGRRRSAPVGHPATPQTAQLSWC